jgi:hypothetical protein
MKTIVGVQHMDRKMTAFFFGNRIVREHGSPWVVACVGLLAMMASVGCGKKSDEAAQAANQPAASAKSAPMPASYLGTWISQKNEKVSLVVTEDGISCAGVKCEVSLGGVEFKCLASSCKWSTPKWSGSLIYDAAGKTLTTQTISEAGDSTDCAFEMTGLFARTPNAAVVAASASAKADAEAPIPEEARGTWWSCNNNECGRIKLVVDERLILSVADGEGECRSKSYDVKTVRGNKSMVKLEVQDGPYNESTISLLLQKSEMDAVGGWLDGHYTKKECVGGKRTAAATAEAPAGGKRSKDACTAQCVADHVKCADPCTTQPCRAQCAADAVKCHDNCE